MPGTNFIIIQVRCLATCTIAILERRAGEEVHKEYMWYKGYAVLGVGVDGEGGGGCRCGH